MAIAHTHSLSFGDLWYTLLARHFDGSRVSSGMYAGQCTRARVGQEQRERANEKRRGEGIDLNERVNRKQTQRVYTGTTNELMQIKSQ